MTLKFSQLALFCALVEEGTIHAAAEKMHCVPSNISSRIKELELNLRVNLFQHEQRKLNITPEGRGFYLKAKALLQHADECQQLFESEQMLGVLNIGIASSVLTPLTPADHSFDQRLHHQIIAFLKQQPTVQLNFATIDASNVVEKLLNTELDLVINSNRIRHPRLHCKLLYADPLYWISHHPSFKQFKQHMADEIYFSYGQQLQEQLLVETWLTEHHRQINTSSKGPLRQCQFASYALIFDAIQQQLGYTVLARRLLSQIQQPQLYAYPIESDELKAKHMLCLIWKNQHQSKLVQHFIDTITQHPPIVEDVVHLKSSLG